MSAAGCGPPCTAGAPGPRHTRLDREEGVPGRRRGHARPPGVGKLAGDNAVLPSLQVSPSTQASPREGASAAPADTPSSGYGGHGPRWDGGETAQGNAMSPGVRPPKGRTAYLATCPGRLRDRRDVPEGRTGDGPGAGASGRSRGTVRPPKTERSADLLLA